MPEGSSLTIDGAEHVPQSEVQEARHRLKFLPQEAGFSLMEVIIATVIATVAVIGLAYTFGMGRGFINRFEVSRVALAAAEARVEALAALNAADTMATPGQHMCYLKAGDTVLGTEFWTIDWANDPADDTPVDLNQRDLRRATVTVVFRQGSAPDSVQIVRYLPAI